MKRILLVGKDYALTKYKLKQSKIRYISLLVVLTSMCLYAVKQASAQMAEPAATAVANIKPLQIGDTIPEDLWHLPLQVVNHPEGKDTVTLGDYRNKLIILDFWSTWCISCIKAMPKLAEQQARYPDDIQILPITQVSSAAARAFQTNNTTMRDVKLPSIVADTMLKRIFPHQSIPHVVWISPDGIVQSTSGSDYVNEEKIERLLAGRLPDWTPKVERINYDYSEPLMALQHTNNSSGIDRPYYYSCLAGYLPGIAQKQKLELDSVRGTLRWYVYNVSLYSLILSSMGLNNITFNPSFVKWRVVDKARYRYAAESGYVDEWKQDNLYRYEMVVPIGTTLEQRRQRLRTDLHTFFPNLKFYTDTMETSCLLLVKTSKQDFIKAKSSRTLYRTGEQDYPKVFENCPLSALVHTLNRQLDGLPVFDETGYTGNIDLHLPVREYTDLPSLRKALQTYGLDLVSAERRIPLLVIEEQ